MVSNDPFISLKRTGVVFKLQNSAKMSDIIWNFWKKEQMVDGWWTVVFLNFLSKKQIMLDGGGGR